MRVLLVNPPHSQFDLSELGPPLGLLRLAGIAREAGWEADIIDLNLLWHTEPGLRADFFHAAGAILAEADASIYGFTSMAVDSHVALELARGVKRDHPDARVVLGGTHFSAIAGEVPARFPWIDAVITGEGETEFAALLGSVAGHAPVRGLSPGSVDYDILPLDPYFAVNPYRTVDVESARGCRFSCAFCYSPTHFSRRRTLDTGTLLREMSYLAEHGTRHVFFVQDNFLNDEVYALALCAALADAKLPLTWHCYATLPQINERVITAMARAGCRAVFTGIDAIGSVSERRYGKRFSSGAEQKIQLCLDHGMAPTCAFLVAPPSHSCGVNAEQTIRAALVARALGAQVRLNVLTYYPGTRLASAAPERFAWDERRVHLEMDVPEVVVTNPYAVDAPQLFPFHARYVSMGEWDRFIQQIHVLFTLLHTRTDELADADRGDALEFFALADRVLASTGDLFAVSKPDRRRREVEAFDSLIDYFFSGADYVFAGKTES